MLNGYIPYDTISRGVWPHRRPCLQGIGSSSIAWPKAFRMELEVCCELVAERIHSFSSAVFECVNLHCTDHQLRLIP